jgi:threonine dehydratase
MPGGATLAEGIAVTTAGALTKAIVQALVRDVVLVSEAAIECAVEDLLLSEKTLAEGAGAASLAALLEDPSRFRGKRVALVISGGNIDARILSTILLRGLFRAGRLFRLRVEILDQPGALARISGLIAARGGNIIEVYHQRLFHDVPIKTADLDLVVETRGFEHGEEIIAAIRDAGFPVEALHS